MLQRKNDLELIGCIVRLINALQLFNITKNAYFNDAIDNNIYKK